MPELFVLLFLVPVIVVPVVLLIGFAGCANVWGLSEVPPPPPVPVISATGISVGTIALGWMIDQSATDITFTRTLVDPLTRVPVGIPISFTIPAPLGVYNDLVQGGTYQYTAVGVYADGNSEPSGPAFGTTLPPPTFDAVGAVGTSSGNDTVTASWSHSASGDARAVVVGLQWTQQGAVSSGAADLNASYGGTSMGMPLDVKGLDNTDLNTPSGTFQGLFGLQNPPPGAQMVSVTVNCQGVSLTVEANSVSYTEVSGFGAVSSVAGGEAGTSLSQTVSAAPNETIVQMFTTASGPITNSNQYVRFDAAPNGIVIAEAHNGAASVPFTANRDDGIGYAGQAVPLLPIT
jgi:hypothetical protein